MTSSSTASATTLTEGTAIAPDGVRIHYLAGGAGDPAVVFVHGWLGNAHWWDEQLARFGRDHRVVAVDLAGHGASGRDRRVWSVGAFAADVVAVIDALGLQRVVLVGHSMSGKVILEAAPRLGARLVALVPVDTLRAPQETGELDAEDRDTLAGLRADFTTRAPALLQALFAPSSPPRVVERVLAEARRSPPGSSVAILEANWRHPSSPALRAVKVPIRAINAAPTDLPAMRAESPSFDVLPIAGVGHWPMLEAPDRFDALLEQILRH